MVAERPLRWEITDIVGVKFKAGNVNNITNDNRIEIAIGNLKNGVYLVRISDGVNTRLNRFVIAR